MLALRFTNWSRRPAKLSSGTCRRRHGPGLNAEVWIGSDDRYSSAAGQAGDALGRSGVAPREPESARDAGEAEIASTLAEEAVSIRRPHPDEIPLQPAMLIDPGFDVGRIGAPESRGRLRKMGEMKPEARFRRDADAMARDMSEQDRAGRLARPHDAHARTVARVGGPSGIVVSDPPAMIVIDINRFRPCRQRCGTKRGREDETRSHLFVPKAFRLILTQFVTRSEKFAQWLGLFAGADDRVVAW